MPLLKKLERLFGRFALHHLALYLIIGQVGAFVLIQSRRVDERVFLLSIHQVLAGEPWRLFTFLFLPPPVSLLFIAFSWYLFYLMGSALEEHWGAFRFNLFLLTGYLLTVGAACVYPSLIVTDLFLAGSVFLAFAHLFPDFELAIFFILPVKIKWLALVTWLAYAWQFYVGGPAERLSILAATGNFLLFFSSDLWLMIRMRKRKMQSQAERFATANTARHQCRLCGKTNLTHPDLDFRYCSKCAGAECYCPEHMSQHEHVTDETSDDKKV